MELQPSYLECIQAIKGDTPGEKLKTISTMVSNIVRAAGENANVSESTEIPQPLVPLIRVEVAKILKKHDVITESLKCTDSYIVNKALQATWYFDGSMKTILSVDYIRQHLLPYVSLNTRCKIVKTFAIRLCSKDEKMADELFDVVAVTYGVEQALPLFVACSESFTCATIVKHKIILPRRLLKVLYRHNPNVVIEYLKLSNPKPDPLDRNSHYVGLSVTDGYLCKLVKKHLDAFVEIFEKYEYPVCRQLSNKCAEALLKNGRDYVFRKPAQYIQILPLKFVSEELIEVALPKLMVKQKNNFHTDWILGYLEYYPKEKKVPLLKRIFKELYGEELLANTQRVTPKLLIILPTEERIQLARIKMKQEQSSRYDYTEVWRCYLPTSESIPQIKKQIAEASDMSERSFLLYQMIYTCKVNGDDAAILEFLKYYQYRHRNEQNWVQFNVLGTLLKQYNVINLSEAHWAILEEIIQRFYVKDDFAESDIVLDDLLEADIHYRLLHGKPIDRITEIFIDKKIRTWNKAWNIILKNHEFERKALESCLEKVRVKYESKDEVWLRNTIRVITELVQSIYDFNDRHTKPPSRVDRMSIKSYPWLLDMVKTIVQQKDDTSSTTCLKDLLEKYEKEYYLLWANDKEKLPPVQGGKALRLLKRDPKKILDNWKEYLKMCKDTYMDRVLIRFLSTVRWYKDIPIKFSRQCMDDFTAEKEGSTLFILSVLLDGNTFKGLIEPLIPTNNTIDIESDDAKSSYGLLLYLPRCIRVVNPPLPLSLVGRFCNGDYISAGLGCLTNVCRRRPVPEVLEFAKSLVDRQVSVRKHGIRLVSMVESLQELSEFLRTQWKVETNKSIREVLFSKIIKMFQDNPGTAGWPLINSVFSDFTVKDESALKRLILAMDLVSNEYIAAYIELLLSTIDKLAADGLEQSKVMEHTTMLMSLINAATCNILPEELCRKFLKRYLFNVTSENPLTPNTFALRSYLFSETSKLETRIATVCEMLKESVRSNWDKPHAKKSHHLPVNYAVHVFVDGLVSLDMDKPRKARIVDAIFEALTSVLTPYQITTSYFMLLFSKYQLISVSVKDFGEKLVERLPTIVDVYSPLLVLYMCEVLKRFLEMCRFGKTSPEDATLDVMESLVQAGGLYPCLLAAGLLKPLSNVEYVNRYERIVQALRQCNEPIVQSVFNDKLMVNYLNCINDPDDRY